ncbi:MAG: hypothetical protein ACR2M0_06870 [Chloroflexia bacterium]
MARVRTTGSLLGILLLLTTAAPSMAQSVPQKEKQAVYNGEIFDGQGYSGQFYPAGEHTIYVPADVRHVLTPKMTLVYWWAITHEYKADWQSLNEPITGTLEIGDRRFTPTTYSLRQDGGYTSAQTTLLLGDAATKAYAGYQKSLNDYQTAQRVYTAQWNDFQSRLLDYGQKSAALQAKGQSTKDLPIPKQPDTPTQPTVTIIEPAQGIPFSLPAGTYQMQLRGEDGKIVAGSDRTIVAFAPRREGIAYKVIAASKWTLPDTSTNPDDTIFVSGEKALYVQPAAEREYDNYYAAKMMNPQDRSVQDRRSIWSWIPSGTFGGTKLSLRVGGTTRTIDQVTYYAKQTSGSALGYDILPYDKSAGEGVATFKAFMVTPQTGSMTISAPGVPGSSREIRAVNTGMGNVLLGISFAPLLGGLLWLSYRRRRTK